MSSEVMALEVELNGSYGESALLMLVLILIMPFLSQLFFYSTSKLRLHNNWLNPLAWVDCVLRSEAPQ